jgi:hypothetical protein
MITGHAIDIKLLETPAAGLLSTSANGRRKSFRRGGAKVAPANQRSNPIGFASARARRDRPTRG